VGVILLLCCIFVEVFKKHTTLIMNYKIQKSITAIEALGFKLISPKHSRTCEYMFQHISSDRYRYAVHTTNYVRYTCNKYTKYYEPQMIYKNVMSTEERLQKLLKYLTKMKKLNRLENKSVY